MQLFFLDLTSWLTPSQSLWEPRETGFPVKKKGLTMFSFLGWKSNVTVGIKKLPCRVINNLVTAHVLRLFGWQSYVRHTLRQCQLCKWKNLQVQITDAQPLDLLRIIPKLPSISGLRKPIKYDKLPRIICNQNTLDDVIIYCTCMFTDLYFRNQPNILIDIYI